MKILAVGDLIGSAGIRKLKSVLPELRKKEGIDFVIVNGENSAEGMGMTEKNFKEILEEKVDVITMGNHTWGKKDIFKFIDHPKLIRPANYTKGIVGKGYNIYSCKDKKIAVINLIGRVDMNVLSENPFVIVKEIIENDTIKIDRVYLTGTLSVVNNIDLYFQEVLQNEKVEILKPFFIKDTVKINIKDYIENNPDEFEDLFIANNTSQFEKLFPKTYVESLKEQAVSRFKNENVMEAVRYGLAYPDNMKSAMTRQFVNNDKYKTLLVFNNNKNILGLTPENIMKETKEELEKKPEKTKQKEQDDIQKTEVETVKNNNDMSVFIKLSGKEKESFKGIYLPIDSGTQVFIPKQLYRIDDGKLQILNSQSKSANMSEYAVDENTRTKKFMNRLTLDNFYHKYFNLYEISMEKEVIPSASY